MSPPIRILFIASAGLALASVGTLADIAPTQYVGYGISPVETRGLRMVSAQVDIVWGTPCTLSATFVIDDQTAQPVGIHLGFPVQRVHYERVAPHPGVPPSSASDADHTDKIPRDLAFAFDGVPIDASAITVDANSTNQPYDSIWYRCFHTFPPGPTKVTVTTSLPASLDYNFPGREHLYYCIETGGSWAGAIGSENVTIHFPGPVLPGQIIEASPADYSVDGDTVQWRFKDFKPKGQDHDVVIAYLRPDMASTLARVRAECARDPSNPALILKLAKDLFVLGPYYGYAPYPPDSLTRSEFADLLAKIKNERDRALFQSRYALDAKDEYREKDSEWTAERLDMLRILNAADYQPSHLRTTYVDEAKALVEKLLAGQPANAAAWNVYFANYYRFRFAGGGRQAGGWIHYPHEIEQIEKAVALCPQDPGLKLWYQMITHPSLSGYGDFVYDDSTALRDQLKQLGVFYTDFPPLEYNYF